MMKVLFCGKQFDSAFEFTKEEVSKYNFPIVIQNCEPVDLINEAKNAAIIIPFMCRIDRDIFDAAKELRMVMQFGVGLEGVDIEYATEKGVWVCNIQSEDCGNAQSCAEHAIFLCLALMRNLVEMKKSIETGRLGFPTGHTLYKSRCMIFGFGGIGRQLLRRLICFEPSEIVIVVRKLEDPLDGEVAGCVKKITFHEFMIAEEESLEVENVFLCCTQNQQTRGLVNHRFLSKFSSRINLINVARVSASQFAYKFRVKSYLITQGGLLHLPDIEEDIVTGKKIRGLATDVYPVEPFPLNDALLRLPNIVATPHVAGVTVFSYRNMAKIVADNIIRIYEGQKPLGNANLLRNEQHRC